MHLSQRGAIPRTEWSAALGREIEAAANDPARADAYYQHWLPALERMCAEKGMVEPPEMEPSPGCNGAAPISPRHMANLCRSTPRTTTSLNSG